MRKKVHVKFGLQHRRARCAGNDSPEQFIFDMTLV